MKILVTGGSGQLGKALSRTLAQHEVLAVDRQDFDVADYQAVLGAILGARPDVVVHAAAMTDVDGCERDPMRAYRVNTLGTQNVALACDRCDVDLVSLSTDYVFDGLKGEPYLEFDEPNPLSVYGRSKLWGERLAIDLHRRSYVVRTAWMFDRGTRSFVTSMLRLADSRAEIAVVDDESGSPTYAPDLATAIGKLIETRRYGVYHFANDGGCSRFELAREALRLAGTPARIVPTTTAEYRRLHPTTARRPADSRLHNFAGSSALGICLPPWQDALARMLS